MACEECSIRFSVFKRKKQCGICLRYYCKHCLIPRRDDCVSKPTLIRFCDKKYMCRKCRILSARPLNRTLLLQLRVKDLQSYLSSQKISTRGCVEKDDLVNLLLQHVNESNNIPRYTSTGFHSQTNLSWGEHQRGAVEEEQQQRSSSVEDFPSYANPLASDGNNPCERIIGTYHSSATINLPSNLNTENSNIPNSNNLGHSESGDTNTANEIGDTNGANQLNDNSENLTVRQEDYNFVKKNGMFMPCSGISLEDIKSTEEMEKLSVRQIKELLSLNRVDFRGCCEKAELLERLSRLWQENHKSRTDLDNLNIEDLCKICMDAPIECVILECGHMATCMKCGKQLNECPICRQFAVRVVRIFRA